MLKDSRILVTGSNGMLGFALVKALREAGYCHVSSDYGDLRNKDNTDLLFRKIYPDYVFHCAAKVYGIRGNATHRKQAFTDNVLINTNVIAACDEYGVRKIVAMGSNCVYSDAPNNGLPIEETEVWNGPVAAHEAPYGNAKRAMLAMLEAYDIPYAFVVASNMYGPNDKFDIENGHVIPSLVRKFYEAQRDATTVYVWGDGTQQRNFMYSSDAAAALIMIMQNGDGVINLTGAENTIQHVVNSLCDISGVPLTDIIWDAAAPVGHKRRYCSPSKLYRMGFNQEVLLPHGLALTYSWYSDHVGHILAGRREL